MKYLVVLMVNILFSHVVVADIVNCQTKPAKSSHLSIRQTLNGTPVGQLRPNTPITVMNYNIDNQGQLFAYISWQGQPLAAVKKTDLQQSGWIAHAAVSCNN